MLTANYNLISRERYLFPFLFIVFSPVTQIVILWHMKNNEVKYSWLDKGWCGPKDVPRLTAMLNGIHSGKFKLEMTAVVAELNNEHAKVGY